MNDNFEETLAACPECGEPAGDGNTMKWWPCCSHKCLKAFNDADKNG